MKTFDLDYPIIVATDGSKKSTGAVIEQAFLQVDISWLLCQDHSKVQNNTILLMI